MINLVADDSSSVSDDLGRIAILYENDAWLDDLFEALAARDVPFTAIRMDDAAARPRGRAIGLRMRPVCICMSGCRL